MPTVRLEATDKIGGLIREELMLVNRRVNFITDCKEFRLPNFKQLKEVFKEPSIFESPNLYDPIEMKLAGFECCKFGRSTNVFRIS